jgi:hypothetical protein
MDLKKIDTITAAEKGFTFTFIDPTTGDDSDLVIEVIGAGSRTYKQAVAKIEAYKSQCYKRGKTPEDDVLEEKHIELLAACTKGWKGLEEDGKAVPFSVDEAKRIYAAYPLLIQQVSEAIHNVVAQLESK